MRLVSLLISICLWTGTTFAQTAAPIYTRTVNLPVVGLASSETAQVNVVNLAPSVAPVVTGGAVPTGGITASCTGGITFYDTNGNSITSATFTIGSGQIYSAPLAYSAIPPSGDRPSGNGRTAIWSTVTINGPNNSSTPCLLASNVETFDTMTGVTHVHTEGSTVALPLVGNRPAGDPPMGH
jgi:hypothetical protein